MSTDDTLSRRIRDEGARRGAYKIHGLREKEAQAVAKVNTYQALRARHRADELLRAVGIDPNEYEQALTAAMSK